MQLDDYNIGARGEWLLSIRAQTAWLLLIKVIRNLAGLTDMKVSSTDAGKIDQK